MVSVSTPESRPTTNGPISTGRSPAVRVGGQDRAAGRPMESEVGSGNERRRAKGPPSAAPIQKVTTVVVEQPRPTRRMNHRARRSSARVRWSPVVVLDEGEVDDDLVRDMTRSLPPSVLDLGPPFSSEPGRKARRKARSAGVMMLK